jgi:DNA polymerase-4
VAKVWKYCEQAETRGRTVTLKVKYADFEIITRRRTETAVVESQATLEKLAISLLGTVFPIPKEIRLLGVTLSSLDHDGEDEEEASDQRQLTLLD